MGKKIADRATIMQAGCPLHLRGTRTIARTFGVSRSTVTAWREAGAPILQVGKCYQASYRELWNWLKKNEKNFLGIYKNLSSGPDRASTGPDRP